MTWNGRQAACAAVSQVQRGWRHCVRHRLRRDGGSHRAGRPASGCLDGLVAGDEWYMLTKIVVTALVMLWNFFSRKRWLDAG